MGSSYRASPMKPVSKDMLNNKGGEYQGHMDSGKSKPSTKAKRLTGCTKEMKQDLYGGKKPQG